MLLSALLAYSASLTVAMVCNNSAEVVASFCKPSSLPVNGHLTKLLRNKGKFSMAVFMDPSEFASSSKSSA